MPAESTIPRRLPWWLACTLMGLFVVGAVTMCVQLRFVETSFCFLMAVVAAVCGLEPEESR